jgi:hypothetical protein
MIHLELAIPDQLYLRSVVVGLFEPMFECKYEREVRAIRSLRWNHTPTMNQLNRLGGNHMSDHHVL